MSFVPELNDAIREAFGAQEAFDNWDNGKTFYDKVFGGPRFCALQDVVDELDTANLKLVQFVLEHGAVLLADLGAVPKECAPKGDGA
jgi:hypothetical protein